MTTPRERLIQAAEETYRQERQLEDRLRAWLCSRFGLAPGTTCEQVERIIRTKKAENLSHADLLIAVQFVIGLPPEYVFTQEQIEMAAQAYQASRGL